MANTQAIAPSHTPWQTYGILIVGLLATSIAAIFIRLAQGTEIPSLVIAASRLTIAALVITPITLHRYQDHVRQLTRRDFALISTAGLFLAIHFITWISSLEFTSVLISSVLVSTSPLWIALLEQIFLKSRLSRFVFIGLLAAVAGGIIISLPVGDHAVSLGSSPLMGSVLSLAGAAGFAVYLVIGRGIRPKLPLLPYIWLVYGSAAITALLVVFITRTQVAGYEPQGYFWVLAVALVPQLIGHSSFNYAVRYISATFVGIAGQLEPAASAVMAILAFQEIPRPVQVVGSIVMLFGVILAIIGQQEPR